MITTSRKSAHAAQQETADLVHLAREEARLLNCDSSQSPGDVETTIPSSGCPLIPGYELKEEIHRGSQGIVYRAVDDQAGTEVAIKVTGAGTGVTDSERQRFDREVELLERLQHPAIVSTLDRGIAGQSLYFVMPLIRGSSLDQYVNTRALSIREKIRLFIQVVEAVEAAHRVGVIHRDLKPSNIMIDEDDRVRLIDFGLAAPFCRSETTVDQLTKSGQFIGSLPWSSPEHAGGDTALIDVRSDVYSLGVILYQMVIGAFPYSVDGGPLELLERIRNEPADRPTDLEPTVPRDVETILLTCLQKDPARRYQTTSQLRDDLCRWLNGEPISATGDSLLYVGRMLLAKHRTALLIGLFTWVAGLAFGLLMAVLYQDAADGKTLAEQKSTQSQQENEKLRARIRELEARVLKPGSWVSAIQSANELSELSAEEGWQFISRTWPMLEDVKTKQQFLKAVAFSRHPWTHRGMQLGMLDPSPEVQSWAINYIRNFAFLDPAEHREDYLKWYEQHKDQPLNEAIASSLRRVAGELKGHISDNNTVAMERVAALIGDSSALRDVRTAEIRTAVADTGLADDLLSLTQSKQKELRRAAADALARLPVTEDFVRSDVLPMLESSDPGVVSPVARMLARYKEDWAKNALLRALERGVAAENLGQVFSVAGALSDLGDASVIPPMIAAIESNNEYITVYGVGYFGLSDLTGVRYDESHDGKWWREWWGVNKDRFSLSEELSEIPATPESKDAGTSKVIQIDDDPQARYMLVKGAAADSADTPRKLLLILPGGDGGPDFRSFTKRIGMHCTDEGWIVAQLIAPQWDEQQHSRLVWPTRSNPYEGMRFSTEEQALKVIADIQRQFRIDQAQIYTLAWSSAGPAAYAMAASSDVPVAGALIAMSVFKPEQLSSLEGVKGRRVYVLHSPQDFIAMRFPQSAVSMLSDAGAATKLATYEGGHGWHGDVYGNIRTGLEWLQKRE